VGRTYRGRALYQWPATLIGRDKHPTLMADLHQISVITGRPVTALLQEAAVRFVAEHMAKRDPIVATIAATINAQQQGHGTAAPTVSPYARYFADSLDARSVGVASPESAA